MERSKLEESVLGWLLEATTHDDKHDDKIGDGAKTEDGKSEKTDNRTNRSDLIFNLSAYCEKYKLSKSERGRITKFFGNMRNRFSKEQEELEKNGFLNGNESEKFEQSKQILRNSNPPLFYVVYARKQWVIPIFEKKIGVFEQTFNRDINKLLNNLKEMAKYNEYKLESSELSTNDMIEKVKLFQEVVNYCQTTVKVYNNRIYELVQKNEKISKLYNSSLRLPVMQVGQDKEDKEVGKDGKDYESFTTKNECTSCKSDDITPLLSTKNGIRSRCNLCDNIFVVTTTIGGERGEMEGKMETKMEEKIGE